MNKNIKKLGITVLALAIAFFLYNYFSGSSDYSDSGIGSSMISSSVPAGAVGGAVVGNTDEFSAILNKITSINIDTTIFNDPAYKSLRDNPVVLGVDTMGRTNPFAPIGVDADAPINSTASIQTLPAAKITSTSAELGASVSLVQGSIPVSVMIQYGLSEDSLDNSTNPMTYTVSGTNIVNVENLLPNTTYFVRAIAVQGSNTVMGEIVSFNTAQ